MNHNLDFYFCLRRMQLKREPVTYMHQVMDEVFDLLGQEII